MLCGNANAESKRADAHEKQFKRPDPRVLAVAVVCRGGCHNTNTTVVAVVTEELREGEVDLDKECSDVDELNMIEISALRASTSAALVPGAGASATFSGQSSPAFSESPAEALLELWRSRLVSCCARS